MNRTASRLVFPGLFALSLGAVGYLFLMPAGQDAELRGGQAAPSAAAPVTRAAAEVAREDAAARVGYYSAPVGSQLRYVLDGHFDYGLGQAEAGRQVSGIEVKGGVDVTVMARDAEATYAQLAFAGLELSGRGGGGRDEGGLGAAAQQPLLVKLGVDGRVLGYRFAEGLTGEQRNFVRGLVSAYLHTVPVQAPAQWQASDADAAGEFVADYTLQPGDGDVAVSRRKLRYTAMAGNELHPHTLAGGSRAVLSHELGWLREVSVDERSELRMQELGLTVDLATKLSFRFVSAAQVDVARVDFAAEFLPAAGHKEDLSAGADAHVRSRWEKELANTSLSQLIAELTALLRAEPVDAQAVDHAFQAVSWLVKLKPEVIAELIAFAKADGFERLVDVLVSALGAAGTDAAQTALADLRRDATANPKLRTSATVALFQVAKPGLRVMGDLVSDLSSAGQLEGDSALAMLLLGALAPRAGDLPIDGGTAFTALLGFETKATQQGRLDLFANALGNVGDQRVLPQVQRLIGHEDARVRAAAYHALRHVETEGSLALLGKGLADADAAVRADAVVALGDHRSPAAIASLVRAARDDQSADVRRAGVQALARFAKPGSAARQTLEQLAGSDPDADVRKAAQSVLAGLR